MKKHQFAVAVCILFFVSGAFALNKEVMFGASRPLATTDSPVGAALPAPRPASLDESTAKASPPHGSASLQGSAEIPEHVMYGLLFREIEAFKKKAGEIERQGQDARVLRQHHKDKEQLDDYKLSVLEQVAADSQREIAKLDKKAQAIIDAERARHAFGRLRRGEALPPPPKELTKLEQQRTEVILRARDQIRGAFGEVEFERFSDRLKKDAADRIKPLDQGAYPKKVIHAGARQ